MSTETGKPFTNGRVIALATAGAVGGFLLTKTLLPPKNSARKAAKKS